MLIIINRCAEYAPKFKRFTCIGAVKKIFLKITKKNLKNCDKSIDIWQIWTYTVSNQSKRLLAMVLSEERIWEKS